MSKAKAFGKMLRSLAEGVTGDMSSLRRVDSKKFSTAIQNASKVRKGDMVIGDMLTVYKPEEYAKMKTFLSKDGLSGYALKGNELVSVFSIPGGRGEKIALDAAARGARNLDNFDVRGKLPELYERAGFLETTRFPYDPQYASELSPYVNKIQPDVVMMHMNPQIAAQLGLLRGARGEDVRRIVAGKNPRITRNRRAQDLTALAALAGLIGAEEQQ